MSIGCNICGQSLPDAEPHLCEPMTRAEYESCGVLCLFHQAGRDAPAKEPVADEDVEIASAAYWPHDPSVTPYEWATLPDFMKAATRARIRRALEALNQKKREA